MIVELRYVPDCPLVGQVRDMLDDCLLLADQPVRLIERAGDFPSPTLLIDGIDVATGAAPPDETCCRLDLPTRDQIAAALRPAAPAAFEKVGQL